MKLAFVGSSFPAMPCGVGDYAANLAHAAGDAGHDVVVFTSADPRVRASGDPAVHPIFRDWTVREFLTHLRRIRRECPDAVVLQYPSLVPTPHSRLLFLLPVLARAFLPGARVVLVVHEFAHTHDQAKRLLGVSFRFAHEIVAVTPADVNAIEARHRSARGKVRLASIGSNLPRAELADERRAELRDGAEAVVLFFGLLHGPDKGVDELLQAMAELDGGVTLAVTGSLDESEPYQRRLGERVESLGLARRVRWLGFLEPAEVGEWLQAADVVALPFRGGAAPNRGTLAGALLNGAAVLTTSGSETPEWLRGGVNAALVPPNDPAALSAALRRLLGSADELEKLREGARALSARFEWPAVAAETLGAAARPPDADWPADGLERVTACPACGVEARRELHTGLRDRVSLTAPGAWTLWQCRGCGSGYLDPRPSEDAIGLAYRGYHTHGEPAPRHAAPPGRLGRLRWALGNGYLNRRYGYDFEPASRAGGRVAAALPRRRWLADMRVRHLPRPPGRPRLLDVGCGNGTFLRDMRDSGWEVAGIDPDPEAVATARRTGADVREGLLGEDTFPRESFDAVTLSHVVEHLPDPAATLAICRRLLKPGGLLWVATPNLESRGHARFGEHWRGLEPPRHLTIFTWRALIGLLERLGFDVVAQPRNYMAEFFFRASAAIAAGRDPGDTSQPAPPAAERAARRANALTVLRRDGAEELMVVARRP